jgi:hypothetical protein
MSRKLVFLLGASLAVSACGGDGESLFGEPPSNSFPITSANGADAARVSWETANGSGAFAGVGAGAGLSGAVPGAQTVAVQAIDPEDIVIDVVSLLPFGPDSFGCAGGTGSATLSGNIADPLTLSRDDTFRIEYDQCDDGAGTVIDGAVDMTIVEFAGDLFLATFQLTADTVVDNLSLTTASDTVIGSGDASIRIDTTQAPFVSTGVSGASLVQTTDTSSGSLTNYASDLTYDGNQVPAEFTIQASGTIDSSELPGSVNYSTEVTFTAYEGSYPHTGALLVEGDNSTARLIALDAENVRIEIDSDGDGTADDIIDMTWDALLTG